MQVYRKVMKSLCLVTGRERCNECFDRCEIFFSGAGSILASIATASCRTPTILGKPHPAMFEAIRLAFPDVDSKRTVMIGDRLVIANKNRNENVWVICLFRVETDISFGNRQGATTLLVFSGATSEAYLETLKQGVEQKTTASDLLPNFCVKDVAQFLQLMQSNWYRWPTGKERGTRKLVIDRLWLFFSCLLLLVIYMIKHCIDQ